MRCGGEKEVCFGQRGRGEDGSEAATQRGDGVQCAWGVQRGGTGEKDLAQEWGAAFGDRSQRT
eukprot:2695884-Rhodomonas_salina.1